MSFKGESFRQEEIEKDGTNFEWHADILTYEDFWEIEMMYRFNDPEDQLFDRISGANSCYNCQITGEDVYPSLESRGDKTAVAAYIPVEMNLDHEIAEFPGQYLEQLRDGFYQQTISDQI